jgi:hypothetical protein
MRGSVNKPSSAEAETVPAEAAKAARERPIVPLERNIMVDMYAVLWNNRCYARRRASGSHAGRLKVVDSFLFPPQFEV